MQNFRIGGERFPREFIYALGIVKKPPRARTPDSANSIPKLLPAIEQAADEVIGGKLDDHFPLVVWQTGSGTQTNMNANKVIGNRASEILGGVLGSKSRSPQRSRQHVAVDERLVSDAMHVAVVDRVANGLLPALSDWEALEAKSRQFANIVKDWPHPPDGRDAADAGTDVFGLCGAGRGRPRGGQSCAATNVRAGSGRNCRRNGS